MKEARYFYVPNAREADCLPEEEARHAMRVLRLSVGDEMFLIDGEGCFCRAEVTLASSHHCGYRIVEVLLQQRGWRGRIHLAIAPTKDMGRIEWLAEKAVEVGVDEISFLECQFSERRSLRADRVEKIVVAAMKQSRKAWRTAVNPLVPFRKFVEAHSEGRRFICHCYSEIPRKDFFDELRSGMCPNGGAQEDLGALTERSDAALPVGSASEVIVLVGPEGDFSVEEVRLALDKGYESVTLGQSRLRTETAGLSAVMMSQLVMREEQARPLRKFWNEINSQDNPNF